MGTSWWWDVVFSHGSLTTEIVEHVLARTGEAGLSVRRPDGAVNSFSRADGHRLIGPPKVSLSIDSGVPRPPAPDAHEFRRLHRRLTELWLVLLDELGADFGRVDDEWSLEQVWHLIPKPVTMAPPPPGALAVPDGVVDVRGRGALPATARPTVLARS